MENEIRPKYYKQGKIEVIDFIIDHNLDFCLGNVVKYVCRAKVKNTAKSDIIHDLQKAKTYLDFAIEEVSKERIGISDCYSTNCRDSNIN